MHAAHDREVETSREARGSRRMSNVSNATSIRGGADGNGAVDVERWRSKGSPQLQRVDEEGFYASDMAANGGLQSPVSSPSDFASDEEIENRSRQGDRRRASAVSFSSKATTRAATLSGRDAAPPRRSSLRQPLQTVPPAILKSRRSSRFGSAEYVAATLDEKKQKKLVALFYWRRKALETYLSAWKWVTFDSWRLEKGEQHQHQQRELELLRPYAHAAVRPIERRPLHQSTLLRNAHERQQLESMAGRVNSGGLGGTPRDRIRSLRDEYRQLKAVERQQAESVTEAAEEKAVMTFKERLRIYYHCFEAWHKYLETTRAAETKAAERAVQLHIQRVRRRYFRAWSKPFMVLQHAESRQWERVSMHGDMLVMRRRFRVWRQWLASSHAVNDLQKRIDARQKAQAVETWRAWVNRTIRIRQAERKLMHRLKRRSFQRMKLLRTQRREKEQLRRQADELCDRHIRNWAWGQWKRNVFDSDEANRRDKRIAEVSCKLAVGKWKRFIARRRADHERTIQADSLQYEVLLRRSWVRWCAYMNQKRAKIQVLERASKYKLTQDKRRVIRLWVALRCELQYDRDQANGATRFYEQRLVQSFFQKWRVYARDLHTAREWRSQRVKRQFVLSFVAWRQHTQRSARLRAQFVTLEASQRRQLLADTLRTWQYQQRLRVAFATVAHKRRCKTMQLQIHAWHQVSAQRRQWQQAIENVCEHWKLRLKRRLLVAWFGVTARSRCRSKLIRLFQRKHNRKRLKRCMRVLHVHANLQQIEARTQQRSIESVWHAWVVFISDQQRKTEAMIAANQFYVSRRCSNAVGTWSRNVSTDIKERQRTHKALSFLIDRVMRTTFHAWCCTTEARRKHRGLVETQVKRHDECLARHVLRLWRGVTCQEAKKREVNQLLCRHLIHRLQQTYFTRWLLYTRCRHVSRQQLIATQQRLTRQRGRRVLHAWRIVAFRLRRKRTATQLVASHSRKRIVQEVLRAWRVAAAQRKHYCLNRSKAVAFHREFLLLWSFYGWQHASLASLVLKEKARRAVNTIVERRHRWAVMMWKKAHDLKLSQQLLAGRAVHFYRQRRRRNAIAIWQLFSEARVVSRRKNHNADAFANTRIVRRCMRSWIQFTSSTRAFKTKLRVVFQTGDEDTQRKVFRRWRRYKRSSTLCLRAESWRDRTQLATIWRHWRAQVAFCHKMKANVLVTSRLLQSNTLRATFVQWTEYLTRRQRHVEALKRGEAFHARRCHQLAIWRFRVQVRHARVVELSEAFYTKHALRQSWTQWLNGVKYQQHWRKLDALAISTYRSKRSQRVFNLWRGLVEARRHVLHLKADSFCMRLALKHVWKAWKRIFQSQIILHKAVRYGEKRVQDGYFTKWREFTEDQQLIRRHVNAAVAHLDRVTMQKIWERWLIFLERRRHVHLEEAKAQSFYSTRVLLTRTMNAWGRFLEIRHRNHALRVDSELFCALRMSRKCFGLLQAYALYRHQRADTINMRDEAVKESRQRRAIVKWHERAGLLHNMRESTKRAASFCKERRLSEAICALVVNKAERTKRRQEHQRAVGFRRGNLSRAAFARWQIFLTWRHRTKHLLRLFRSNQLGDYFALWHKYVNRSQQKRQLQAKATNGYRQLLERNAFARWQARCTDWQNKRRAINWYVSRMTCQVFAVWSHRVRILHKMRLMFRFQDSFRKESHFDAWKRRWWYKKQQVVRVQDASKWFVRHRLAKCFILWVRWLEGKRQEKHTLRMAVGFQRRFFSRKYLRAWHGVILWHERKQELMRTAILHDVHATYHRVWRHLQAYRSMKKRLRVTTSEAIETFEAIRVQRAVNHWKWQRDERREHQRLKELAKQQCDKKRLQRTWNTLQRWLGLRKVKNVLVKRAEVHLEGSVCRRLLLAWSDYAQRMRRLRLGLTRFKTQYFRSVADNCFFEWKAIVQLKCELRKLKHRVQQSQQSNALRAWREHTGRTREIRCAVTEIQQRTRVKLLQHCVSHWEIFATDQWMYTNVVQISLQSRDRRIKKAVVERWKTLRSRRVARKHWRCSARLRHAEMLRQILQRWRGLACGSDVE